MTDLIAKRVKERWDRGDRSLLLDPLDYILLGELPIEGTLRLGLYPQGKLAGDLARGELKGALSGMAVSMRLRTMAICGLCVTQIGVGVKGQNIWQRTALGDRIYKEWKEKHDNKPHAA